MALGQNIKKYRKEKKMTQKELATLVGVNEVTIRSYEAEKYRPKIGTLQKIAEALDVSLVALDPVLYEKVRRVLGINLRERHLRGGDATRRMYALRRQKAR